MSSNSLDQPSTPNQKSESNVPSSSAQRKSENRRSANVRFTDDSSSPHRNTISGGRAERSTTFFLDEEGEDELNSSTIRSRQNALDRPGSASYERNLHGSSSSNMIPLKDMNHHKKKDESNDVRNPIDQHSNSYTDFTKPQMEYVKESSQDSKRAQDEKSPLSHSNDAFGSSSSLGNTSATHKKPSYGVVSHIMNLRNSPAWLLDSLAKTKDLPFNAFGYGNRRVPEKSSSTASLTGLALSSAPSKERSTDSFTESKDRFTRGTRQFASRITSTTNMLQYQKRMEEREELIKELIGEVLDKQEFVRKICEAFMLYGAPTHRLEEYMVTLCRALDIGGTFFYVPGAMIISFSDESMHTSEMYIARVTQGINLGKLQDVFNLYKRVVHKQVGGLRAEALEPLKKIHEAPVQYNKWLVIFMYGLASLSMCPVAFFGRALDLPICFFVGCIVGILQMIVNVHLKGFKNVLEVSSSIITSFIARGIGSIKWRGNTIFCFSAIAQSATVLILPGYIVLCGSLELQSKSLIAGSVRTFYAVIYSFLLSFGILIGSVILGSFYPGATGASVCDVTKNGTMDDKWRILMIPVFTMSLMVVNYAKYSQMPIMMFIACSGYAVQYYISKRIGVAQVAITITSFYIGFLGNIYSRIGPHFPAIFSDSCLAFAAMLPGVFLILPSSVVASAGLRDAIDYAVHLKSRQSGDPKMQILSFGFNMIQISIGISVGLFISALVVYPRGKVRGDLFAF